MPLGDCKRTIERRSATIRGLRPDQMGPLRPREKQNGSGDLILRQLGWREFEGGVWNQDEIFRVCAKSRIWRGWSWDLASGVCPCPCRKSSTKRGAFDRQRLSNRGPTNPPDGVSIPAGCKSRRELLGRPSRSRKDFPAPFRRSAGPFPLWKIAGWGWSRALSQCHLGAETLAPKAVHVDCEVPVDDTLSRVRSRAHAAIGDCGVAMSGLQRCDRNQPDRQLSSDSVRLRAPWCVDGHTNSMRRMFPADYFGFPPTECQGGHDLSPFQTTRSRCLSG
jgi:hypothetical protein